MGNSKEKNKTGFIKKMSIFLAGVLATLGIHSAVNALPKGENNKDKNPTEVSDTFEEGNNFREDIKFEVQEPVKTEKEQMLEELSSKLNKAKTDKELNDIILRDIKERYAEEYNEIYETNYSPSDLTVYYNSQSYSYIKDGKFYGKEETPGAQLIQGGTVYRIYTHGDKELEAALGQASSNDINLLSKYEPAIYALETSKWDEMKDVKNAYIKGIDKLYDAQHANDNIINIEKEPEQ